MPHERVVQDRSEKEFVISSAIILFKTDRQNSLIFVRTVRTVDP